MKILSTIFFALSAFSLLSFLFLIWLRTTPRHLAFDTKSKPVQLSTESQTGLSSQKPTGIVIEKIGVWLPVFPAIIKYGTWETTNKGVSYLKDSGVVGKNGNVVFYGHNWPNLLGKLPSVIPGDTVKIIFEDNTELRFTVQTTQEVDPKDTSVLAPTEHPRVTLYTCTGFLDSKRFVVVATES